MQHDTEVQLLATLAQLGGALVSDDDIVYEGTRFVIPETMDIGQAINWLYEKSAEEDRVTQYTRTYDYRPMDGARSAYNAMKRAFGMVAQKNTRGMFGDEPPQLVTVKISATETEQVPWGRIVIPMLPGCVIDFGSVEHRDKGSLFTVTVHAPRRFRFHVEGLFILIAEELATNSLYRGQAFDGSYDFLDLSGVDPANVVYSRDVMVQLEANLWSLLRHTEVMRDQGLTLKRAVLLEGPYGTGKTLAAFLTAREATLAGWTFHYARPGRDNLAEVMQTATLYQPSVVFFEDVDVISDATAEGADSVSRLLDVFDGIAAKGTEIVAVLTTNHVEKIHKGMVRPGRLDAIVHIGALDDEGITRLVQRSIPDTLLASDIDYSQVCAAMAGYMPAFVKEAIDRSLRYSIARGNGVASTITTDDLVNAANGLRAQHDLMTNAAEHGPDDSLSVAMAKVVHGATAHHTAVLAQGIMVESQQTREEVSDNAQRVAMATESMIDRTEIVDSDGYNGDDRYLKVQ